MSDIFNLKRFLRLLRKTIFEKPSQLFGLTFLALGLVLIIYSCARSIMPFDGAQGISFVTGLILGGFFLAASVFGHFSNNAKGSAFLILPASAFEKWLNGVFILLCIYLPFYLFFFRLIDISMLAIYHNSLDPFKPDYPHLFDTSKKLEFNGEIAKVIFPLFFIATGSMLAGSLYFNRLSIINVALLCVAVFFVAIGLNYLIASMIFGNLENSSPFMGVTLKTENGIGRIDMPSSMSDLTGFSFKFILPVLLYLLAFVKLKEKNF